MWILPAWPVLSYQIDANQLAKLKNLTINSCNLMQRSCNLSLKPKKLYHVSPQITTSLFPKGIQYPDF